MDNQSNDAVEWGLVDVIAPVAMALSILMVLSLRSVCHCRQQSSRLLFGCCGRKIAMSNLAESLQCVSWIIVCLAWGQFRTFFCERMRAFQFDDVVCRHCVLYVMKRCSFPPHTASSSQWIVFSAEGLRVPVVWGGLDLCTE